MQHSVQLWVTPEESLKVWRVPHWGGLNSISPSKEQLQSQSEFNSSSTHVGKVNMMYRLCHIEVCLRFLYCKQLCPPFERSLEAHAMQRDAYCISFHIAGHEIFHKIK